MLFSRNFIDACERRRVLPSRHSEDAATRDFAAWLGLVPKTNLDRRSHGNYPSTDGFDFRNGSRRFNSEAILREIKHRSVTFSLSSAPRPTNRTLCGHTCVELGVICFTISARMNASMTIRAQSDIGSTACFPVAHSME